MGSLDEIRDLANKAIKQDFLFVGAEPLVSDIQGYIPTGWSLLDFNMRGGFPMGRTTEVYGKESAGKTSLLIHSMVSCQKMGGTVILFEPENTFPRELATSMGVDLGKILVLSPTLSLEEVFGFLVKTIELVREKLPDVPLLIVWDTLASTLSKKELENEDDGGRMSGQYRATVIRRGMRLITQAIAKASVALVILNHTYESVDHRTGIVRTNTPGGGGVKFYASVRIHLKSFGYIKSDEDGDPIGMRVVANFEKNKLSPPRREVASRFYYGIGFDNRWSLFDYAVEAGIIKRSGSWYSIENMKFYSSKFLEKLEENEGLLDNIYSQVITHYEISHRLVKA